MVDADWNDYLTNAIRAAIPFVEGELANVKVGQTFHGGFRIARKFKEEHGDLYAGLTEREEEALQTIVCDLYVRGLPQVYTNASGVIAKIKHK